MMNRHRTLFTASLAFLASSLVTAVAQPQNIPGAATQFAATSTADSAPSSVESAKSRIHESRILRLEGEQRFRVNCGRCHMAPPKFPPRAMATVLRHMRVRALITDEDRRLILRYMTE